jgi:hypothetical protein
LSREFAAPTKIVVGSELGAASLWEERRDRHGDARHLFSVASGITDRYSSALYGAINARHVILTANSRTRPSFVTAAGSIVVSRLPERSGGGA